MANQIIHHQFARRRGALHFFLLLLTCLVLVLFNSCKKPEKIKFFALKYEKAAIKKWLDSADRTAGFILQFYSTNGERYDTAFGSISYQLDSALQYNGPDTLLIERDSAAYSFTGPIILGNNWISRTDINSLFDGPGDTERDFDYILLIPRLDEGNNRHVVYDMKVYKGTTEIPDVFVGKDQSKPSPPAPPGG